MDATKQTSAAHEILKARLNKLMSRPSALAPAPIGASPTRNQAQCRSAAPVASEPAADASTPSDDTSSPSSALAAEENAPASPVTEAAAASADNRGAPRKRSNLPAMILMAGSQTGTPCLVLDMSATGARLKVPAGAGYCHPNNMPSHVALFLKSDWLQVDCEIVRRADHEMGVRFCSAMRPVPRPQSRMAARQSQAKAGGR